MTKILVATEKPFAKVAIDGIKEVAQGAGFEVALLEKYTDKKQLLNAVADAEAIIIRSDIVDAEVLDAAKKLRIVVRAGAGYDNVDLAAATAHGVCVMNTPGQNANAVAELALGMLVYALVFVLICAVGLRLLWTGLRLLRAPVWLSLAVVARAGLLGPGLRLLRTGLRLLRTGPLRLLRARLRFWLRL